MIVSPGKTLVYGAALAFGEQVFRARQTARIKGHGRTKASSNSFEFNHQAESDCLQDLLSLIKELIVGGSNLHGYGPYKTPLSEIIFSFGYISCINFQLGDLLASDGFFGLPIPVVTDAFVPLMMWLELLYECGIDLVDYGRREIQLLQEDRGFYSFRFPISRCSGISLDEGIK
jgi:hypothetical protein